MFIINWNIIIHVTWALGPKFPSTSLKAKYKCIHVCVLMYTIISIVVSKKIAKGMCVFCTLACAQYNIRASIGTSFCAHYGQFTAYICVCNRSVRKHGRCIWMQKVTCLNKIRGYMTKPAMMVAMKMPEIDRDVCVCVCVCFLESGCVCVF